MSGYTSQGHIKSVIAAIFGFIGNEPIVNGSSENKFFTVFDEVLFVPYSIVLHAYIMCNVPPVPLFSFLEGTRNTPSFFLHTSTLHTPSKVRKGGRRGDREEEISGRNHYLRRHLAANNSGQSCRLGRTATLL